ncbi:nitroreductase family protein [Chloroflexota bacterium]
MEVLEAIKTRRSIRHYKPDPIDDKTLETIMEAAQWAPSWKNTQCWRFIVVRNHDTQSRLAEALLTTERGDVMGPNPSTQAIQTAPVVIVACAELEKSGFTRGKPDTDKGDWYMYDVALAMQNLALAAHSLGLGTVHVGAFDAKKAAAAMGVPEGSCVVAMTPLGFPAREGKAPPRKERSEIIFHDRYGH